jgi:hypothetical protein
VSGKPAFELDGEKIMTEPKKTYNHKAIYDLLLAAFTAEELQQFCRIHDDFEPLLTMFSPKDNVQDMAGKVIDFCQRRGLWEQLLIGIKEHDEYRYSLFESRLLEHEDKTTQVLSSPARHLTGDPLRGALDAARAIEDKGARVRTLSWLAPQLMGPLREEALAEAVAAAQGIEDKWLRARLLTSLAGQLMGAVREEALAEAWATARAIEYKRSRADALAALADKLTGPLREAAQAEAVAAAQALDGEWLHTIL